MLINRVSASWCSAMMRETLAQTFMKSVISQSSSNARMEARRPIRPLVTARMLQSYGKLTFSIYPFRFLANSLGTRIL
jgi:hypothetical protein